MSVCERAWACVSVRERAWAKIVLPSVKENVMIDSIECRRQM